MAAKKKRKNYTPEFIAKTLAMWAQLTREGVTAKEFAKREGLNTSLLYKWKKTIPVAPINTKPRAKPAHTEQRNYYGAGSKALAILRKTPNYNEIERLREQNKLLQGEIDTLRAALMVLARHSSKQE
jgi:transposase-like protein